LLRRCFQTLKGVNFIFSVIHRQMPEFIQLHQISHDKHRSAPAMAFSALSSLALLPLTALYPYGPLPFLAPPFSNQLITGSVGGGNAHHRHYLLK
jgi:hypothetical protein